MVHGSIHCNCWGLHYCSCKAAFQNLSIGISFARSDPLSFPMQEYVSLAFSADGKMLLAQGGAPDWNLVLWVWEKSKVAATVKTTNQQGLPVYSCTVSPQDGGLVGIVGQNIFKVRCLVFNRHCGAPDMRLLPQHHLGKGRLGWAHPRSCMPHAPARIPIMTCVLHSSKAPSLQHGAHGCFADVEIF